MSKNFSLREKLSPLFNLDLKMSEENSFFIKVYNVVRQIPEGKVTSYGAIAKYLGSPQSSRMVGWAMNASHSLIDLPAHRVVNRKGLLTGKHHFGGAKIMQQLLENEGIVVIENQIQDFEKHLWDPIHYLKDF